MLRIFDQLLPQSFDQLKVDRLHVIGRLTMHRHTCVQSCFCVSLCTSFHSWARQPQISSRMYSKVHARSYTSYKTQHSRSLCARKRYRASCAHLVATQSKHNQGAGSSGCNTSCGKRKIRCPVRLYRRRAGIRRASRSMRRGCCGQRSTTKYRRALVLSCS